MIGFIEWAWVEAPWFLCVVLVVVSLIYVGAGKVLWFCLDDGALNSPALGKWEPWARFSVIALWPFVVACMVAAGMIVMLILLVFTALGVKLK